MLWPIVLPVELTIGLLAALVGFATVAAPAWKWKRRRTFVGSSLLAGLLFVPSCVGIMEVVDNIRFGTFQYASYLDVKDIRVERYLPPTATNVTLKKYSSGHMARYTISESDLKDYVDELWKRNGEHSAISHKDLDPTPGAPAGFNGIPFTSAEFESTFLSSEWPTPDNLIELHGPSGASGSGAVYVYDRATQTGYHRASYW